MGIHFLMSSDDEAIEFETEKTDIVTITAIEKEIVEAIREAGAIVSTISKLSFSSVELMDQISHYHKLIKRLRRKLTAIVQHITIGSARPFELSTYSKKVDFLQCFEQVELLSSQLNTIALK